MLFTKPLRKFQLLEAPVEVKVVRVIIGRGIGLGRGPDRDNWIKIIKQIKKNPTT